MCSVSCPRSRVRPRGRPRPGPGEAAFGPCPCPSSDPAGGGGSSLLSSAATSTCSWLLTHCFRGLAGLAPHVLAFVPDPLGLVRLRLADRPDLRGRLPHQLLVDAPHRDPGRLGDV